MWRHVLLFVICFSATLSTPLFERGVVAFASESVDEGALFLDVLRSDGTVVASQRFDGWDHTFSAHVAMAGVEVRFSLHCQNNCCICATAQCLALVVEVRACLRMC